MYLSDTVASRNSDTLSTNGGSLGRGYLIDWQKGECSGNQSLLALSQMAP